MQDEIFAQLKKAALVDEAGLTYVQFRKGLTPRWGVVWLHIALGWTALVAANLFVFLLAGRSLGLDLALAVVGAGLTGFSIAYLQLFLHEAAHFNIHPRRKLNDLLCNLFVSGITGQDVKKYRPIHWDHHRFLGTTMDTEISYFDPLNVRFLVEALLGIRALKVIALRRGKLQAKAGTEETSPRPGSGRATLIGGMLFNLAYLSLLAAFQQWVLILAWVGGVLIVFPFFGALRQVLEHRSEQADTAGDYTEVAHGAIHRLFGDDLLASSLGGAGFNRHLLHHWEPDVSYTRLHELERYLMGTAGAAYLRDRQTTYWKTFWRLFRPAWR